MNRQLEVENLHEDSFVAQRLIADHVRAVGGVFKVVLSKDLLASASVARQCYRRYLDDQKKNEEREGVSRKRKVLDDEIDAARKRKKFLEDDVKELLRSADSYAQEAEAAGKLTLLTKSNSLRRTAKDKEKEVEEVEAFLIAKKREQRALA